MHPFIGASTSLNSGEYADLRSKTAEEPFKYLIRHPPSGQCANVAPFTCSFREGGNYVSTAELRVGSGLTKVRGDARLDTQLVGPGVYQHGNGDRSCVKKGTKLRNGFRQVRKGEERRQIELKSCAPFQFGQHSWVGKPTAERGRYKYDWAVQSKELEWPGCPPNAVEPFQVGGMSSRFSRDF